MAVALNRVVKNLIILAVPFSLITTNWDKKLGIFVDRLISHFQACRNHHPPLSRWECAVLFSESKRAELVGYGAPGECLKALTLYPTEAKICKIAQTFGGEERFCQLPQLPWQDLIHQDISKHPYAMMRGMDPWYHPYVAHPTDQGIKTVWADDPEATIDQDFSQAVGRWATEQKNDQRTFDPK